MLIAGPVATADGEGLVAGLAAGEAAAPGEGAEAVVGFGAVVGTGVGAEAGGGCAAGEHAAARSKVNPSTRPVRALDGVIEQTVAVRL
jgi:hypothetical protein